MAKQLNLDLNIRANTQQAKQEFQNLQKSLSDVIVQASKINNTSMNTNSLKQASAAAQELQRHLSNAVNVDTGKINLNKLNTSLKQSKTNIGELSGKLLSVGPAGQQAFVQLAQSVAAAERPVISLGSRLSGLLTTLKNTARWQISSSILHGFMGALQGAYGYAQDLNKSLNNIRIVTGQTTDQMEKFAIEANRAAKSLSTSTTAYTDAALIYYQQGLGDAEVKERTEATIKLANVSRQSAEEVSSQMTAIWNNFKTEGKTVEYYEDVITALGANTASSSSEIAEGLSKFAAVADTVGLSYEKASAALATVVAETRQSADVVGTAFKTMFARIEGLKQGETLEDGVGLNKYSEALQKVGVNVLDSNNQLKQMDTILDELGNKWNQIDKTQQVALAQTVAGVRQYTQFISLMDNYDKVSANEDIAKNSEGTLQKQADIYAESWEAAQKRVKASLQSIYTDLLDDKFFIQMNNFFADLLDGLHNFIKGIGGLKGVLLGLGSLFLNYISDKITPAVQNLTIALKNTFQSPKKQAEEYSKTMQSILSNVNTISQQENLSNVLKSQLSYTDQLSAAKDKLMQVQNKLTDSEKMSAEQELNIISIYQQEAEALAQKVDKEKEDIQTMIDKMNSEKVKTNVRQKRQFDLDANEGDVQEAKALKNSYSFNSEGMAVNDSGEEDMSGYLEASQMYTEASEKAEEYKNRTNDLEAAEESLREKLRLGYEDFVKMNLGMTENEETIINLGTCLDGLGDDFLKLGEQGETAQNKIQKTSILLEELDQIGVSSFKEMQLPMNDLKRATNEYNKALVENAKALKSGDEETKVAALKNLTRAENDFNNSVKGMGITLGNLNIRFKKSEDGQKNFNKVMKNFGENNNVKKIDAAYKDFNKTQEQSKEAQDRVNAAFASFNPQHMMSGVEALTKITSAGTQAAMIINSIRTIMRAWTDENMDPMERFTTTLMSIGMIIPGVISSISGIASVINAVKASLEAYQMVEAATIALKQAGITAITEENAKQAAGIILKNSNLSVEEKAIVTKGILSAARAKDGALTLKEAVAAGQAALAKEGEAAATGGATVAQWNLNAAMEANPIGAIIAAIMALIAALAILTFFILNNADAEDKEAKAVEEANKALDEAKEAAQNAKQAYEDLKSAVSKYDTAVDALKKCTKGTQEWRDAFKEVLLQANEIIQKYPQLLKYEKIFNSDGTLNTETLNKALKDAEDYSLSSQNIVLIRQNDVTKAEYNLKKKDLINKAANQAGEMNKNYGSTGATKKTNTSSASGTSIKSASMQEITENVIKNIGDKIGNNYDNKDNIKELVKNYLEEQNTFKFEDDNKLNEATEAISSSITKVSGNFVELSETTEQTMDTMNNASKMLLQNLFGDEINADNELAYVNATAQKRQELETKYQKGYLYMADEKVDKKSSFLKDDVDKKGNGDDIVNGAIAIEMIEKYLELHKDDYIGYNETDVTDWKGGKNGTVWVNLKSKEGNEVEIKASDIKDDVIENELAKAKGEISQAAKEEVNKQEYKDKMSKAVTRYLTDNNFDNATIGSIKAAKKDDLIAEFQGEDGKIDKEKVKTFLEKKYPGQSIGDSEINSFIDNFNPELESALEQINKIPTVLQEGIRKELVNSLTIDEAQKVGKMYNKAIIKEGEDGVAILDNIVESAGSEAGKVMTALADIDLSNLNTEEVNQQLKSLGIQFQLTDSQFYSFKNAVKDLGVVTTESAQETYKNITSILSKIKKIGDSLEDADYQKLLAINPTISSFFTTMADGTHMLTGSVQDFKKAVQTATINELYSAQKYNESTAAAYGNLSKGYTKRSEMDDGAYTVPGVSQTQYRDTGLWSKYQDQTVAQIKILRDNGQSDLANQLEVQIRDQKDLPQVVLDTAEAYDKLNLSAEDYATKAKEASEEAKKLAESIKEVQYQNEISNAGLEYETTENYANILMEVYEAQGLSKDAARELSIANQRLDNGLSSLNDNFKDWSKSLKNTNKASTEYAETITSIREAFANLLNIADGNELSLEWLENWMNDSSEMEKILDGDTEALQRFRESAFKEMTKNVFSNMEDSIANTLKGLDAIEDADYRESLQTISDLLASGAFEADNLRAAIVDLGNQEIGSGATLSQEYVDSLNEMLAQGLLTEQQLDDIFATIGYKPKVTTKSVQQWVDIPVYETTETITEGTKNPNEDGTSTYTRTVESSTRQIRTEHMQQNVPVAQIESADEATGNIEIVNAGSSNIIPSYSSTSSGKKSDSSSSSNKNTSAPSHDHEVNRYSNEENAVNGLTKEYEKLGKAKDQAFGAGRVHMIEQELKALKELKQASGDYLDAVAGKGNAKKIAEAAYTGKNIGSMISSGQLGGTIKADYNSLYGGLSASGKRLEYTAKDSDGNEWLASDNYSLSGFNSLFGTNLQFSLDSFGNIQNKDSILNLLQNLKNNENDAYSRVADPSAGSTTEHNKRMAYLEEIKERIEQYGSTAELLSEKTEEYLDYISQLQEKNAELITEKMNNGVNLGQKTIQRLERAIKILGDSIYKTAEAMQGWFDSTFKEGVQADKQQGDSAIQAIEETNQKVKLYEENPLDENALSPAKAAELLSSAEDTLDGVVDSLLSRIQSGKEYYGQVLDYWNNKLEAVNRSIENNIKVFDHLQNILSLLGRSTDYEAIGNILQGKFEASQEDYLSKKAQATIAKQAYEQAKQNRENLIAEGISAEALEVYDENVLQKALDDYQTKADAMYTSLEETIELSNQLFENEMNKIMQESEDRLTGEWGNFSDLDSAMKRQQSISDEYLTKTNQIYETNSLLRKLSQDIDKNDSLIAKKKLKAFSDEITAMQTQEKLSKTDLEIAKARYEVLKAQIALEEAQNAKSTVRLQRDNEGNYGYIYTADQEKTADAEQNLADKQNDLYNLLLTQAETYGQKSIEMRKEWQAEMQALVEQYQNDTSMSEEEFLMKQADINNKYREMEIAYQDSFQTANTWLNQVGAEGQTEAWISSFDTIITQHRIFNDDSINELNGYNNEINSVADDVTNTINDKFSELKEQRDFFTEESKTGNEELQDSIDEVTSSVSQLSKSVTGKNGLADSMSTTMNKAQSLTTAFINQYNALRDLVTKYSNAADEANKLYNRTADLVNVQVALNHANRGATSVRWGPGGVTPYYGSNSNSGNGTDGSDGIGGSGSSSYKQRYAVHDYVTGKDIVVTEDQIEQYRLKGAGPSRYLIKKISQYGTPGHFKSGGYTGTWTSAQTGMYTGSWNGPDIEENGKLAFLHQKELVLNADDTENMLSAVKLIRQISQTIDLQAAAYNAAASGLSIGQLANSNQTLQQEVTIHAEFPNVSDHNEIEEAFNNLVNRASQYANRY